MALKISLRPHEKIVIAGAVIKNGGKRSDLVIENQVPILREKDLMREEEADTPCRRIYFVVQLMYLDETSLEQYQKLYWQMLKDVLVAAPSMTGYLDRISEKVLAGNYYQALRIAWELIDYEEEVLSRVKSNECL
ncbi:MAG: flagellar biosynthesis repressor FlbT [Deltaproteobacteria bacterium]|nr:flagellar biosynthesis repressor FlbT [Deltaproteobacteria bacterium]